MRLIDADRLKAVVFATARKSVKSTKLVLPLLELIDRQPTVTVESVESEIGLYDVEEIYENCTVQVLRNSVTGEVSVGWKRNE